MQYNPKLYKLSNGVTVILDPMDIETAFIEVCFKTGSRDELPHEYGLTHFCEHMLGKGTKKFPTKKLIDDYLELNCGIINAATGNSSLCFRGKILAENINILIEMIADELENSLFLPENITTEKKVIIDELRRIMDDPEEQLGYFISNNLFNGASISYRTLGTKENIMSFSREQIINFLSKRLSSTNCIICISGKIENEDNVLKCLENNFKFLKPFDVPENTEIHYTPKIAHNLKPDKKNIKLRILFPDIWNLTLETRFKQKCINDFETFLNRRLFRILRYENGLVYDFNGTSIGNEKFSLNGFATETSKENLNTTIALIAKNSYKIYNELPITENDLIRFHCKNKLFNADWLESASYRCRTLLSFYFDFQKIYDHHNSVKLQNSVTIKDVKENSRGYFNGPISIITQGQEINGDLKQIWEENFK